MCSADDRTGVAGRCIVLLPLVRGMSCLAARRWRFVKPELCGGGRSDFALIDQSCEVFKASIISGFRLFAEKTPGQLSAFQVITDTVAAESAFVARGIGAGAVFQVLLLFAFHGGTP